MLKNNPKAKKPNFEKWAEHIEKLIGLDKRTTEEIAHVIQWSQQDDFWKANVLSTQKLRKAIRPALVKVEQANEGKRKVHEKLTGVGGFCAWMKKTRKGLVSC